MGLKPHLNNETKYNTKDELKKLKSTLKREVKPIHLRELISTQSDDTFE